MKENNDGGPAFPVPMIPWQDGFINVECTGASLRDWLASHASEQDIEEHTLGDLKDDRKSYNRRSREQAKYAYADAMIKARSARE